MLFSMTVIFSKLPLQFTGTNGIIHKLVYSNIYFPCSIRGPKSKGGGDFVNNYEVMYIVKPVERRLLKLLLLNLTTHQQITVVL